MAIRYCKSCKDYTLKESCKTCKNKTEEKSYKFKFQWFKKKETSEKTENKN